MLTETSEMQAGREMDAVIAERLFGYVWRRSSATGARCIYPATRWPEWMTEPADGTERLVGDWTMGRFTPTYSTDVADAWRVVEHFGARGWALHLKAYRHVDVPPDMRHGAAFWSHAHYTGTILAPTSPLAICRAALSIPAREGTEPTEGSND